MVNSYKESIKHIKMYNAQLLLDKVLQERYFFNHKNKKFIECGAFDGLIDSNTFYFYKYQGWTGFNVEPLPNIFQHLQNNRPNDININAALSDVTSIKEFTQAISRDVPYYEGHFGNGSLEHTEEHKKELDARGCRFEKFLVKTYTIPDFFIEYKINYPIDLFVLDVEGHEAKVLTTMKEMQKNILPMVFVVEYGHSGFENIKKIMLEFEYKLDYVDQINAVFIRE